MNKKGKKIEKKMGKLGSDGIRGDCPEAII